MASKIPDVNSFDFFLWSYLRYYLSRFCRNIGRIRRKTSLCSRQYYIKNVPAYKVSSTMLV